MPTASSSSIRCDQTLRYGIARGQLTDIADVTLVAEACYGLVHTRALLTSEPLDRAFARRTVHAIRSPYLNPSA